jgi:hypothetical protein
LPTGRWVQPMVCGHTSPDTPQTQPTRPDTIAGGEISRHTQH